MCYLEPTYSLQNGGGCFLNRANFLGLRHFLWEICVFLFDRKEKLKKSALNKRKWAVCMTYLSYFHVYMRKNPLNCYCWQFRILKFNWLYELLRDWRDNDIYRRFLFYFWVHLIVCLFWIHHFWSCLVEFLWPI